MAARRPAPKMKAHGSKSQPPTNGGSTAQPAKSAAKATAPKGTNPFATPKPTTKKPATKRK